MGTIDHNSSTGEAVGRYVHVADRKVGNWPHGGGECARHHGHGDERNEGGSALHIVEFEEVKREI